jgi:hypothetical protein
VKVGKGSEDLNDRSLLSYDSITLAQSLVGLIKPTQIPLAMGFEFAPIAKQYLRLALVRQIIAHLRSHAQRCG